MIYNVFSGTLNPSQSTCWSWGSWFPFTDFLSPFVLIEEFCHRFSMECQRTETTHMIQKLRIAIWPFVERKPSVTPHSGWPGKWLLNWRYLVVWPSTECKVDTQLFCSWLCPRSWEHFEKSVKSFDVYSVFQSCIHTFRMFFFLVVYEWVCISAVVWMKGCRAHIFMKQLVLQRHKGSKGIPCFTLCYSLLLKCPQSRRTDPLLLIYSLQFRSPFSATTTCSQPRTLDYAQPAADKAPTSVVTDNLGEIHSNID